MRYPIGTRVVFWYHTKFLFGVIENRHTVKRGVYTYDIRAEHGSVYIYVPVDDFEKQIWIDTQKTISIAPQIVSNLRLGLTANLRGYEQIPETGIAQIA
jgi:hypothetical protein